MEYVIVCYTGLSWVQLPGENLAMQMKGALVIQHVLVDTFQKGLQKLQHVFGYGVLIVHTIPWVL